MICTFYSYKGGVGRSMAMANVADILARRGLRVLMIDFDLEAPGLEQFFHTNVEGVRRHPGLVDLLLSYKQSMSVASGAAAFKDVDGFIVPIYEQLPGGGRLHLLPAGQRQDPEQLARYALALRTFDWQDFYYNWEGDLFFEWLRRELGAPRYDIVLVDSRTGVTEMGGICGYQLADVIVMLCASNNQNVQGTANMLRDFRSASVEGLRRGRPIDIVVVPARIEQRDPALLDDFFQRFDASFGGFMPERLVAAGIGPRDLMIPYEPRYAFQERVVSDPDADERHRIGAVFERLADAVALLGGSSGRLVEGAAPLTAPPAAEAKYDATRRFAGYDVYLDGSRSDEEQVRRLAATLQELGLQVFVDREDIAAGAEWVSVAEEALFHSRALLMCIGAAPLSEWRQTLLGKALAAQERGQTLSITPVLLEGAGTIEDTPLRAFQSLDFRRGVDRDVLAGFFQTLKPQAQTRVETDARVPYVGAQPFGEQHADLFFGRDAVLREIVAALETPATIVLSGPSGCGKTSLVSAGLLPALRAEAPARSWIIASMTIGTRPLQALAEARSALSGDGDGRRLLFVDQLEKLLGAEEQAPFMSSLGELAGSADRPTIVLAVRADARRALAADVPAPVTAIEMGPMSTDDLRRVVAAPAERVGLAFEPGLVDRIVADLHAGSASLALGQRLLLELWKRRRNGWLTNAAYAELGGMQGFVAAWADATYDALAEGHRSAMRSIMLRLVRVGQAGESTRRRVPRQVLAPLSPEATSGSAVVLDAMIDAGLLVATEENGEPVVEAAHEALVRGWPRLLGWLEDERGFLEWRERLTAAMSSWEAGGRSQELLLRDVALTEAETRRREHGADLSEGEERYITLGVAFRAAQAARKERLRRYVVGGSSLVAAAALLLATFAGVKWREAVRQKNLADSSAQLALDQAKEERERAAAANHSLQAVFTRLQEIEQEARNVSQQRDAQAAELQRAQATAAELRKTLDAVSALQTKAANSARKYDDQIKRIEDLQQQIKK